MSAVISQDLTGEGELKSILGITGRSQQREEHLVQPIESLPPAQPVPPAQPAESSGITMVGLKYACPACRKAFAKWSACRIHVIQEAACKRKCQVELKLDLESDDFQERCKTAAREVPPPPPGPPPLPSNSLLAANDVRMDPATINGFTFQ
eukprot:TRINITY_DN120208_c0_g1_i1.p1 TRINITY_DN120208_c0_g1~~TRINITY_DN120208_c0_g1_i1.p1  ORF type:complete len:177 (-),score=24.49 TRINITY_DN120208_c0_g1_i1:72-524(-)